jgi:hypothetical protein
MALDTLAWFFTGGLLIHNLEEAILLPAWTCRAKYWPRPIGKIEFFFAVGILSGVMVLVIALATVSGPGTCRSYLITGLALAMCLNAIMPHLIFSLRERSYMPGTGTALLLNLPLGGLLIQKALLTHRVRLATFCWSGPCVVVALLALMPGLLYLGRKVASHRGRTSTPESPL